jgi:hypothetical protein
MPRPATKFAAATSSIATEAAGAMWIWRSRPPVQLVVRLVAIVDWVSTTTIDLVVSRKSTSAAIWQETTLKGIHPCNRHATLKSSPARSPTFRIAAWITEYDTSGSVADSLVAAGYRHIQTVVAVLQA